MTMTLQKEYLALDIKIYLTQGLIVSFLIIFFNFVLNQIDTK
jgi:hypothetical protein